MSITKILKPQIESKNIGEGPLGSGQPYAFTPPSCLRRNPRLNDSRNRDYTKPGAIVANQDGRHFSASRDLIGFVRQCARCRMIISKALGVVVSILFAVACS
ncbi:hypothetical protein ElyMa_002072000 [Elysia marginata]|uniref:Uncharacterized protein n=1 Tax=Elysia marginata TaxID=1093978 RepID=A0AAV4FBP2_9GAST|nr:hypothetical protein ElyMa_002072000 [Elysia marginata]